MTDLTYVKQGLFTAFYPESNEGKCAWDEIAKASDGTGKIPTVQLDSVLYQLRKSGYSVSKGKKSKMTMDDVLNDLGL